MIELNLAFDQAHDQKHRKTGQVKDVTSRL
jgi:hypothetical protein